MRDEYDFSNAIPARDIPHLRRLHQQEHLSMVKLEPDILAAVQQLASQDKLSIQQELNMILRQHLQNQSIKLEDLLRKVIREELNPQQQLGTT